MRKSLVLLLTLILIGTSIWYFLLRDSAEETVSKNTEPEVEESVGRIKPLDPKKVVSNPETGEMFVNDQILITFKDGTQKEEVEKIVKAINGEIVGFITITDDYQVELKNALSSEQLTAVTAELMKKDSVIVASLSRVSKKIESEGGYEIPPNDQWGWGREEWENEVPNGNNWYLEAIRAEAAWKEAYGENGEKVGDTNKVKIGVIDNHFEKHSDIKYAKNGILFPGDRIDSHGTRVAGLIGATPNNNKIGAGVTWNHELYGYGYTRDDGYFLDFELKYGIAALLAKGVRVINASLGRTLLESMEILRLEKGDPSDRTTLEETYSTVPRDYWTPFFEKLLDNYDFLFVSAAGNYPGDARYLSRFNAIDDPEIKDHIITVSSIVYTYDESKEDFQDYKDTEDGEKYTTVAPNKVNTAAYGHSYSDRVDILAPGEDIYSPTLKLNERDKHNEIGTSFAAPLVTGVAGLIWNVNPDLSAKQVKEILIESADREELVEYRVGQDGNFPVLNALRAVELAKNTEGEKPEIKKSSKDVFGIIRQFNEGLPIEHVNVSVRTMDDQPINGMFDSTKADGSFEIIGLKKSKYKFVFSKTGYTERTIELEISNKKQKIMMVEMEPVEITETTAKDVLGLYEQFNKELIKIGEENNWDYIHYDWDQITPAVRSERREVIKGRLLPLVTSNFAEKHILPNLDYIYSGDSLEAPYFPSQFDERIRLQIKQVSATEVEIQTITFARSYTPGFHYTIKAVWDEFDEKWKLDDEIRVNAKDKPFNLTQEEAVEYLTIDDITAKFITDLTIEGEKMHIIEQKYPTETQLVMVNASTGETELADPVLFEDSFDPIAETEGDFTFTYETIGLDTGEIKGNVPNGGTIMVKNGARVLFNRTGDKTYWYGMPLSGESVRWESVAPDQAVLISEKIGKTTLTFNPLGDEEFVYTLYIVVE